MIKSFTSKSNSHEKELPYLYLILIAGISLRLYHYLDNRSLWEDEVFLASSLIHMNFTELATLPLDYQQRAPIGFLWFSRLSVLFWDKKEMALRLFPFVSGIAALIAFVPVSRYFLKSKISWLAALCIVALAPPIVYHSVEAKQYGTEFLATVLSLLLYTVFNREKSVGRLLIWGVCGALILWFSFSSLFILFGIAGAVSLTYLVKKEWKSFFLYLIPFSIWLLSFLVQYVFFISRFPEEEWLVQFWRNRDAFMPLPPRSAGDLLWPVKQIYSLVRYPIGLTWIDLDYLHEYSNLQRFLARMPVLPIILGLSGLWFLFKSEKRVLLLLSLPVILALMASSMELYPLRERLTIFLAPIFILVMGKGIDWLFNLQIPSTAKKIIVAALLAAPAYNSIAQVLNTNLFGDYKKSRQREAMTYLQKHYQPGDVVYVYWNNLPSYLYYQKAYDFKFNTIRGNDVRLASTGFVHYFQNLSGDFDNIKGYKRLWYAYKPYNGIKIGDIENEPKWYYQHNNGVQKMLSKIQELGTVKETYPASATGTDIKLYLLELHPDME